MFFCKLHEDGFVMQRNPADKKTIAELDAKLIDQAKQLTQLIQDNKCNCLAENEILIESETGEVFFCKKCMKTVL